MFSKRKHTTPTSELPTPPYEKITLDKDLYKFQLEALRDIQVYQFSHGNYTEIGLFKELNERTELTSDNRHSFPGIVTSAIFLLDGQEISIDIKEHWSFYVYTFYIKRDDYSKYETEFRTELGKEGVGPYKPKSETPFDFNKKFGGRKGGKNKKTKRKQKKSKKSIKRYTKYYK